MPLAPTPNMLMQKAEPLVTVGPDWAQLLNTIVDVVDAHDHSSGKGLRVTTAGLNIDADLEFNGNDATELRSTRLESQGAALVDPADLRCVYAVGGDLYYNNGSGAAVQITNGTAVVSSITGAFAVTTPGGYPYSVTGADAQRVLLVDTSSARTITLPAATTAVMFCVKDITGNAATNNITLDPNGTDVIEGVNANYLLTKNRGWWFVISDGVAAWHVGEMDANPMPAGAMQMYGGASAPSGWLLCDGAAVSRTTYARLFTAISTTYGVGDGSTTFNVPDMRQRFPLGKATSGTGSTLGATGGAIDHTHTVPPHSHGMGLGATLAIASSGDHTHSINHDHGAYNTEAAGSHSHFCVADYSVGFPLNGSTSYYMIYDNVAGTRPYQLQGRVDVATHGLTTTAADHTHNINSIPYVGSSGSAAHIHQSGYFTGSIGLVTGGVDGNVTQTSGTQNPPFNTVNYIVKT